MLTARAFTESVSRSVLRGASHGYKTPLPFAPPCYAPCHTCPPCTMHASLITHAPPPAMHFHLSCRHTCPPCQLHPPTTHAPLPHMPPCSMHPPPCIPPSWKKWQTGAIGNINLRKLRLRAVIQIIISILSTTTNKLSWINRSTWMLIKYGTGSATCERGLLEPQKATYFTQVLF